MAFYLTDTNVLIRFARTSDPQHAIAVQAIKTLEKQGHICCYTPQNLVEFWNVCTRPSGSANGFGLTIPQADTTVSAVERLFTLLLDDPQFIVEWRRLVVQYGVSGRQVHDARLAAYMLVHGVSHSPTFNTADFAHCAPEGIVAVDPATV